ncbi:hypothetical protein Z043_119013, partial [Scleropages formosus]
MVNRDVTVPVLAHMLMVKPQRMQQLMTDVAWMAVGANKYWLRAPTPPYEGGTAGQGRGVNSITTDLRPELLKLQPISTSLDHPIHPNQTATLFYICPRGSTYE